MRRLSATPRDPSEPRVVVQIPTMQNRHSTPREPQGTTNPGADVSPEFMPVVRYYEREPRSGRASHNSEPEEMSPRLKSGYQNDDKVRSNQQALENAQNGRSRSQGPSRTDSWSRKEFDEEPRRRFPSENTLQRENTSENRINSLQNPRNSDYRGSGDNFNQQPGRENKGYQSSSSNIDRGVYQRNSHQVPYHPKYQSNQSFDQSFPLPPPRNESRSSSLLRNSQSSLHESDERLRNHDAQLRNSRSSSNTPQNSHQVPYHPKYQSNQSFDQSFPLPPPRNESRSSSLLRNSQSSLHESDERLRNHDAQLRNSRSSSNTPQPPVRYSQPDLGSNQTELRNNRSLPRDEHSGVRHSQPNLPGLRNSQPFAQNDRLPLRNSNIPLHNHSVNNARMSSNDGFERQRQSLHNYNRNYVVEEDENDTLVIGAGMSHQSLESSRDSVAGRGQRRGFYPEGEERNVDDPDTPLSIAGKLRVETEIN